MVDKKENGTMYVVKWFKSFMTEGKMSGKLIVFSPRLHHCHNSWEPKFKSSLKCN